MSEITTEPGYSADDMSVLEGLDAVRKRPGMYIGSTDSSGLNHLVWEIIDNSVDEALAGYATRIDVTLGADGSVQVDDDGRGIPTGINTKTGLSGMELALTKLHAGGKFGGSGYKSAGGLHGVGSSVVNALSVRMDAIVYQNNKEHKVSFKGGVTGVFAGDTPDSKFKAEGGLKVSPDKRPAAVKKVRKTGTTIRWWHDPNIFLPGSSLDLNAIHTRARTTAFLVSGLTLAVHDNRVKGAETSEEFQFSGGLVDMVDFLAPDEKLIDPIFIDTTSTFSEVVPVQQANGQMISQEVEREVEIKVAFRWGNKYDTVSKSYVNVVHTPNGGSHLRGFESGLLKAVVDNAAGRRGLLKAGEANPIFEDVSEGLTSVVFVGFPEPQFEGQTKGALGTKGITKLVKDAVYNHMNAWFNDRKNTAKAKVVLEKIVEASRVRLAQRQQKEVARRKTALSSASMPAKLVDCENNDTLHSELHIVEGDSAASSLRTARDSRWQALMPIRGKIINALRASTSDVLANSEAAAIIQIVGAGSGRDFNIDNMRYSKIMITADADVDGNHIRTLLITLFWKQMRPLVEAGRLYTSVPPLYSIKTNGKKGETIYITDDDELKQVIARLAKEKKSHGAASRFKGLGEMDGEELYETTLNPANRIIRQITIEDAERAEAMLDLAMGKEVPPRKEWIENYRDLIDVQTLDI
ncbi:MAG: type IIA DNA topoisomerase subunit B [Enterococcus sp.]|nr:type IIA DNA topoisomerase subunit B [Enterococcus sp.]